jgi:hypothetical protein
MPQQSHNSAESAATRGSLAREYLCRHCTLCVVPGPPSLALGSAWVGRLPFQRRARLHVPRVCPSSVD